MDSFTGSPTTCIKNLSPWDRYRPLRERFSYVSYFLLTLLGKAWGFFFASSIFFLRSRTFLRK